MLPVQTPPVGGRDRSAEHEPVITTIPPISATKPPTESVASDSSAPRTERIMPTASIDHQPLPSRRPAGAVRTVPRTIAPSPITSAAVPRTPSRMTTAPAPAISSATWISFRLTIGGPSRSRPWA